MSKWYIYQDGGLSGPFVTDVIRQKLQARDLRPIDLIFDENQKSWSLISEREEFRSAWSPGGPSAPVGEWILLQTQNSRRRTYGPFSRAGIISLLASGRISYSDFVWRTECPTWIRIGNVDDLDRRRDEGAHSPTKVRTATSITNADSELSAIPRELLFANINRVDPNLSLANLDELPLEAIGEDLADHTHALRREIATKFKLFFLPFAFIGFLGLSQARAETIEIAALRMNTIDPALLIQTNAPIGSQITIELSQTLGDVPGVYQFSQTFNVTRDAGEVPTVDLETLNLAPGTYRVKASVNHRDQFATFFRGVRDTSFEQALAGFRKEVSFYQQEEKKALFYGAKTLQILTRYLAKRTQLINEKPPQKLMAKWIKNFRQVAATLQASVEKRSSAYPAQHLEMKNALESLRAQFENFEAKAQRSLASAEDSEAKLKVEIDAAELKRLEMRFESLRHEIGRSTAPGN